MDEIVKQLIQYNPSPRFFHYDARGHCTLQTDVNGNIAEQYEYDAFGYPYFFNASGNNIGYSPWGNRFLFTGREWLSDLKLYDYRNRMYQPELGRFMQPDPKHFAAGDYNLYRYCHNDPVNQTDPFGLEFFPGEFEEVDSIPGYFGRTFSNPHITFKIVPTEGGFKPQLRVDVIVQKKEIATHAKGHLRSDRAKEATKVHENKHEAQRKQWHDANQDKSPKGPFPDAKSAEKAGSETANKLRNDYYRDVKEKDLHRPDSEWKGILEKEKK